MGIKVFLLVACMLISSCSAISSDLAESYSPSETAIVKIIGDILEPISFSQVKIKKDNQAIGFEGDIVKVGDDYYVWFLSPSAVGNYTLVIEDVYTTVEGVPEIVDFSQRFEVAGNKTDYSVNPGAVFATDDFEIIVNLYEDFDKIINVDFPESREVRLIPGENQISFSIENVVGTQITTINLGKYAIPAFIKGNAQDTSNVSNENQSETEETESNSTNENNESVNIAVEEEENQTSNEPVVKDYFFRFNPRMIKGTALVSASPIYRFEIINLGKEEIENLSLEYNKSIFEIYPDNKADIEVNGTAFFNLSLKKFDEEIREVVKASAGRDKDYLLVKINFTTNEDEAEVEYIGEETEGRPFYYCSEIGTKCVGDETCSGELKVTIDENECCLGECVEKNKKSLAWIGYLIVGIVIIVLIGIYIKYRKVKPIEKPLEKEANTLRKI